jgi:hypothetical protein
MTCFWTDLVGATQSGCPVDTGLLISNSFGGTPLLVGRTVLDFITEHYNTYAGGDADYAGIDTNENAVTNGYIKGIAVDGANDFPPYGETFPLLLCTEEQLSNVIFDGEPVLSASLTVVEAFYAVFDVCGNPLIGTRLYPLPTSSFTVVIDSPGVMLVEFSGAPGSLSPAVDVGTPVDAPTFAAVRSTVIRVQGTVTTVSYEDLAVDLLLVDGADFCF